VRYIEDKHDLSIPENPDHGGMIANDGELKQLKYCFAPERDSSVHADSWYERNKRVVVVMQFFPPELSISQEIGLSKFLHQ
jgi:hypothetical protein